jgi:flagellar hook-length control protein FliK
MAPGEGTATNQSPPPGAANSKTAATQSGEANPANGKPLPLAASQQLSQEASPSDSESPILDAALLDAAVLSAIAQDTSLASGQIINPLTASTVAAVSDPRLNQSNTLLPAALPQQAMARIMAEQGMAASFAKHNAMPSALVNPANNLHISSTAEQQISSTLPNTAQDAQRTAATPLIPTLLGKPISAAAQQALARASLNSGKAVSLRAGVPSAVNAAAGNSSQGLPAALSGINNPMGSTLRMDIFAAAMNTTGQAETTAEIRLPVNSAGALPLTALPTMGALPDGAINLSADLPRTSISGFSPTLALSTPVGQPAWANELGQRVTWLANSELREAQLQLHPRSLGAVEVRIAFGHEQQVNVSFTAANPIAREALEASLPRLREMFEQQGLNLADANISHESPAEREHHNSMSDESQAQNKGQAANDELIDATGMQQSPAQWLSEGLLDAYA